MSGRWQSEEERCAEAKKLQRIDEAFRKGSLEDLRAALDDPSVLPNGWIHLTVGCALVYAIYWSPLPFIARLLELGADPNIEVDDGFPPVIAALMTTREDPGSNRRTDVDDVLRLLLAHGADPTLRTRIDDYETPLEMAETAGLTEIATILRDQEIRRENTKARKTT